MPHINLAGLDLIKSFEGCELHAYQDIAGVWTIGFGHTGGVTPNMTISQNTADALLVHDIEYFEQGVNGLVSHNATPNQFAALVSFAYNVGINALRGSTLLRLFNAGDIAGAADQFPHWVHAGGPDPVPGLVRRREAERALFLTP